MQGERHGLSRGNVDMSASDFDDLCDGPLAPVLAGLETVRQAAIRRFWMMMAGFVVAALAALIFIPNFGLRLFTAFAIGLVGWIVSSRPLDRAGRALKDPVLAAIGSARGVTYAAKNFVADGYEAIHPLFGRPGGRDFRDRFLGEDDGRAFAFYEATLVSGSGKSRREVFNGLVISLKRHPVQSETIVIPDRGLFNFFSPGQGLERVRFEDDPDFEQKFEVYSTAIGEAKALINPVVREQLKAWRAAHGKVIVRLAGEDATVALAGKGDRFEVGSMLKSTPGRERVRAVWDDLEQGMVQMRQVNRVFG